jgi:hypothetical protein
MYLHIWICLEGSEVTSLADGSAIYRRYAVSSQGSVGLGLQLGHSMSSEPNFQHSDSRMKLSICETKTMNSFGNFFQNFKKVRFF